MFSISTVSVEVAVHPSSESVNQWTSFSQNSFLAPRFPTRKIFHYFWLRLLLKFFGFPNFSGEIIRKLVFWLALAIKPFNNWPEGDRNISAFHSPKKFSFMYILTLLWDFWVFSIMMRHLQRRLEGGAKYHYQCFFNWGDFGNMHKRWTFSHPLLARLDFWEYKARRKFFQVIRFFHSF